MKHKLEENQLIGFFETLNLLNVLWIIHFPQECFLTFFAIHTYQNNRHFLPWREKGGMFQPYHLPYQETRSNNILEIEDFVFV